MRQRLLPYLEQGFVERDPPDQRYRNHPRIQRFWAEQVQQAWIGLGATPSEPTDLAEVAARYFGQPFPPELAELLTFRSTHRLGFCNYGEWRQWDSDIWLPRPEDGNLFEQLACMDQDNILGTAMMQYFVGWVPVGSAGNGDLYLACPNVYDPGRCDVIFFDHETHSIRTFVADSLASLAWVNHCYRQLNDDDFDLDSLKEDLALVAERTNLPWHYRDLEAETGIEPSMRLSTVALRDFRRCVWIDYLLTRAHVGEVADFFDPERNGGDFATTLKGPYLRRRTSTALYWAWRLWWFAKPELEACLDALESHPSPIVTDCVALIRELEAGRRALGRIEDIHVRREKFLALDLDPDRVEEQAEAAQQATCVSPPTARRWWWRESAT